MQLTTTQIDYLFKQGFLHLKGVIPPELLSAALRAINSDLGRGLAPDDIPTFAATSYCPALRGSPCITDLFNSSAVFSLAESLLGVGNVPPATWAQIALRFPEASPYDVPPAPHLDGMPTSHNGVPSGTLATFTCLVGVFLNDCETQTAGNLIVWPGTHRLYQKHFQEHGPQSLFNGMPPVELPSPVTLVPRAGDVVFVHHLVGHSVAANLSPHIRYACYFRLSHVNHEAEKWLAMTDIWRHWPGVRDRLPSEARAAQG